MLSEIQASNLAANASQQEQHIRKEVTAWDHPLIQSIRGKGLLLGFELDTKILDAPTLCKALMGNKLLTVPAGPGTLRWLPPLNVTTAEVDEGLKILKNTLDLLVKN